MIHEVDEVLHGLLTDQVLAGADIEVAFDAPTREWAARRNAPTVNLFLYDVREDLVFREQGLVRDLDPEGLVVGLRALPAYFALSYLVTAWTTHPTDEHRLLSVILRGLARHQHVPPGRLTGSLGELGLRVPMSIGTPPARERGIAEMWTALGGSLKPSLDLVVTAPLAADATPVPAVTDGLQLSTSGPGGAAERRRLRYAGTDAGTGSEAGREQTLGGARGRGVPARRRHGGPPVTGRPVPDGRP